MGNDKRGRKWTAVGKRDPPSQKQERKLRERERRRGGWEKGRTILGRMVVRGVYSEEENHPADMRDRSENLHEKSELPWNSRKKVKSLKHLSEAGEN